MKKLTLFSALLLLLFSVATSCKKETPQPPVASFTCDVNTGNAPMTVRFTSTSTGEISSYFWDFGDGETSSQQNPVYVYVNGGTFTATLTVTGRGGTNSYSRYFTVISSPPSASFTTDKSSGYAPLTIYFTSTSSGNITSYTWNFGDGGMSSSEDPVHTYYDAGTYTATLTVSGTSGSQTAYIIITVFGGAVNTDVTFNNPVFTDIYVTLNGNTQTISPGGSATFYGVAGSSVTYHAVTNGATTSGTQVGEQLVWDHTLTLSGGTASYNLVVTSDYFFVYITNTGTHILNNLYVNYGLSSQTHDNILVPNNSVKYRTGYYRAWTNSNVRMYYQDAPSYYTYWDQGVHFFLPWTNNQSVSLSNTFKSGEISTGISGTETNLLPAAGFTFHKQPKSIDQPCK